MRIASSHHIPRQPQTTATNAMGGTGALAHGTAQERVLSPGSFAEDACGEHLLTDHSDDGENDGDALGDSFQLHPPVQLPQQLSSHPQPKRHYRQQVPSQESSRQKETVRSTPLSIFLKDDRGSNHKASINTHTQMNLKIRSCAKKDQGHENIGTKASATATATRPTVYLNQDRRQMQTKTRLRTDPTTLMRSSPHDTHPEGSSRGNPPIANTLSPRTGSPQRTPRAVRGGIQRKVGGSLRGGEEERVHTEELVTALYL